MHVSVVQEGTMFDGGTGVTGFGVYGIGVEGTGVGREMTELIRKKPRTTIQRRPLNSDMTIEKKNPELIN